MAIEIIAVSPGDAGNVEFEPAVRRIDDLVGDGKEFQEIAKNMALPIA